MEDWIAAVVMILFAFTFLIVGVKLGMDAGLGRSEIERASAMRRSRKHRARIITLEKTLEEQDRAHAKIVRLLEAKIEESAKAKAVMEEPPSDPEQAVKERIRKMLDEKRRKYMEDEGK